MRNYRLLDSISWNFQIYKNRWIYEDICIPIPEKMTIKKKIVIVVNMDNSRAIMFYLINLITSGEIIEM